MQWSPLKDSVAHSGSSFRNICSKTTTNTINSTTTSTTTTNSSSSSSFARQKEGERRTKIIITENAQSCIRLFTPTISLPSASASKTTNLPLPIQHLHSICSRRSNSTTTTNSRLGNQSVRSLRLCGVRYISMVLCMPVQSQACSL